MDDQKEKGPGTPNAQALGQITRTIVREPQTRSKLLIVLFAGYAKVYSDSPASMHVTTIPACNSIEEERAALELAEAGLPLPYRYLTDERLLIGSLSTAVPSLSQMIESEGLAFGLNAIEEAARRSIASKRAERRAAS